jgi:hypothetical protein
MRRRHISVTLADLMALKRHLKKTSYFLYLTTYIINVFCCCDYFKWSYVELILYKNFEFYTLWEWIVVLGFFLLYLRIHRCQAISYKPECRGIESR